MKRTPLFAAHQRQGGKLIEFGGWEMPVQYTSISSEHQAVRTAAGIFDISHMGEFKVSGPGAEAFLNANLTNDTRKLVPGLGQYTLMCNAQGGVVDDLYAYRLSAEEYLLIVNASRIDADFAWLEKRRALFAAGKVELQNLSDAMGAVALQGPRVAEFIGQCFPGASDGGAAVASVTALKKNQIGRFRFQGTPVWVSRTGYTGEDGFEIVAPAEKIESIWEALLSAGRPYGLVPAGLGARDTLRTEACYPLYGHELDENTTPIEAGLSYFVALDKGDFTGREVMAAQKANGTKRKLAAFKMAEKAPPARPHYAVWSAGPNGVRLGDVTSGTQSVTLGAGIGLVYLPPESTKPGTAVAVEIRGRRFDATIVPKPFYRKAN
jgi:aminomethyltransferase